MQKSICAVGFSCADIYEKLNVFYPTGNGVDWAIHLARMGLPASVVSVVGTDEYGEKMREALSREGIDISRLRQAQGDTCIMRMDLKYGTDRVHLEEVEGVMGSYQLSDEDNAFVMEHDIIHTDLFGMVLDRLPQWHDGGKTVVMDFSVFSQDPEYGCETYFPNVDYAFMSFEEDTPQLREWLKKVQHMGPKVAVATLGENGSIAYDGELFYTFGIRKSEVVNTVGAGDSYIAGFTYGISQGWDIDESMRKGTEVASVVVGKFEPY